MYQKVHNSVFICSLKLHFDGDFEILHLTESSQQFGARYYQSANKNKSISVPFIPAYHSSGSFRFSENSQEVSAGHFYKQEAVFSFPSNDEKRAERIDKLQRLLYLELVLTDGRSLILGRNDIKQNAKPSIGVKSNLQRTEISVVTESLLPVTKLNNGSGLNLGYDYTYNFKLS